MFATINNLTINLRQIDFVRFDEDGQAAVALHGQVLVLDADEAAQLRDAMQTVAQITSHSQA